MTLIDRTVYPLRALKVLIYSLAFGLTLSACGGGMISSQQLVGSLTDAQSESFTSDLELKNLTSASALKEEIRMGDVGRSIKFKGADRSSAELLKPTPCHALLPERRRENQRIRIGKGFDMYALRVLKAQQTTVNFTKINYQAPLRGQHSTGDVISAHLGFSSTVGFVDDENELKDYDRCCRVTGSCGEHMISTIYGVEVDTRVISPQDPTLQKSLRAFKGSPASLLQGEKMSKLARSVYQAQAQNKKVDLPYQGWTHFEYRALPQPNSINLTQTQITVEPSDAVLCKPKKSQQTDVIELTVTLTQISADAEDLIGYRITVPKLWEDTTLSESRGPVKLTNVDVTCYPRLEAFNEQDARCSSQFKLNVLPPSCEDIQGDQTLTWSAEVALYAPGDEDQIAHYKNVSTTTSLVKDK